MNILSRYRNKIHTDFQCVMITLPGIISLFIAIAPPVYALPTNDVITVTGDDSTNGITFTVTNPKSAGSFQLDVDGTDGQHTPGDCWNSADSSENIPASELNNWYVNNTDYFSSNTFTFQLNMYSDSTCGSTFIGTTAAAAPQSWSYTPPPAVPDAPDLSGTAGDTEDTLSWNAVSGATSYTLYDGSTQIYSGSGTSYVETGLTNGHQYEYTMTATNDSGTSAVSNTVSLIPYAASTDPTSITQRDIDLVSLFCAGGIGLWTIKQFKFRGTQS